MVKYCSILQYYFYKYFPKIIGKTLYFQIAFVCLFLPRQLVKHYFCVCLCESFWRRFGFAPVDRIKEIHPHQCGLASPIPWRVWIERTDEGRANLLSCLSWDIHLLLPWGISAPGSWAFVIGRGLTPLTPHSYAFRLGLVHRWLPSLPGLLQTWADLYHWHFWFCSSQTADHENSWPS